MKRWQKILVWVVTIPVVLLAALTLYVRPFLQPTEGEAIPDYGQPQAALLVLDIQLDFTGPEGWFSEEQSSRLVTNTNRAIGQAGTLGMPVIYVQNVIDNPLMRFLSGGINAPGAPGTAFDPRVIQAPGATVFSKGQSDAFSNRLLEEYLQSQQVNTIYLCGLDGAACVFATARAAKNRGYRVLMLQDAIVSMRKDTEELRELWQGAELEISSGLTTQTPDQH